MAAIEGRFFHGEAKIREGISLETNRGRLRRKKNGKERGTMNATGRSGF